MKYICGGHGALYLEGEAYLDNLQEAAQQLVDQGVAVLVPSPRPAGAWKTVSGDRLSDPNWASINVNRDTCLTAPPDQIASLSNLQVKGGALNETFKPGILNYTATAGHIPQTIEIIPTATSRRYASLTINGIEVKSGQAFTCELDRNKYAIHVTSPDQSTSTEYTLIIN